MIGEPSKPTPWRVCVVFAAFATMLLVVELAFSQTPVGAISGVVSDPHGMAVGGAQITITNNASGQSRTIVAGLTGEFYAAALLPAQYGVSVEAPGFTRLVHEVTVNVGRTTKIDFVLPIGSLAEAVTVSGAAPQIRYDTHEVAGVVTRTQIEDLPLNGRSFLELAKLEPGAQMPSRGTDNITFVPVLGAPVGINGRSTRITVDGGSIMHVGRGGTPLNLSQEVVQEFQVSSTNFDLTTAGTAAAAVNVVTQRGGNQWHGSAFLFFRNRHLSAFPGLSREAADRAPSFRREQFGFSAGGPLRRDRAFLFGAYERTEQRGLISTLLISPDFALHSRITPSPARANLFTIRTDFPARKHIVFLRHSHEDGSSYGTATSNQAMVLRGYPSAWGRARAWVDQSLLGVTSQFGTHLVNDLRFSYFFVSTANEAPTESDCSGCLGIGAPSIAVRPELFLGLSTTTTVLARRFHLHDVASLQKGEHHIRFGGDWEVTRGGRTDLLDEPVNMTLFPPTTVRLFNSLPSTPPNLLIPLPAAFLTLDDILQLPVQSFTVGIGDASVLHSDLGHTRIVPMLRLFVHDTWRVRPRLTLNFGLGWSYEAPLNYDLTRPAYLEPILGTGQLGRRARNWTDFSPAAGFAWNLRENGKTVIRGGVGRYYSSQPHYAHADRERISLGPRGAGRSVYGNAGIANPLTTVVGVPQGALLFFPVPTLFTGARLIEALPAIRAILTQRRGDPSQPDFSTTNIEVDKQGFLIALRQPTPAATHWSVGIQRQVLRDFVVSADFVYRRFSNLTAQPDLNRFFSTSGPVLPVCTQAQRSDPSALCSVGPIEVFQSMGRAHYRGLLVRADKRFSHGWQLLGSYAYSSNFGHIFDVGFNNDEWLQNYGPLDRDVPHILNLSGAAELPWKIQLGAIVTFYSKAPFSAILGGLDLNGDGTTNDLLPGASVNRFNRALGKTDLRRLVGQFNATFAGGQDARGRPIPAIQLPQRFEFGDSLLTHDLRLSRVFTFRERWRMTLVGEAFNLFNFANLSGYSGDLLSPSFAQPTSRVTQVFGSGGPRSFQLAIRMDF